MTKRVKSRMKQLSQATFLACARYEERVNFEDRLFWWSERAIVGGMILGADSLKWASIQEYQGQKEKASSRYVDLWLMTENDDSIFILESKLISYSAEEQHRKGAVLPTKVIDKINESIAQLMVVDEPNGDWIIALYLSPWFKEREGPQTKAWTEEAEKYVKLNLSKIIKSHVASDCLELSSFEVYHSKSSKIQNELTKRDKKNRAFYKPGFIIATIRLSRKSLERIRFEKKGLKTIVKRRRGK